MMYIHPCKTFWHCGEGIIGEAISWLKVWLSSQTAIALKLILMRHSQVCVCVCERPIERREGHGSSTTGIVYSCCKLPQNIVLPWLP